MSAAAAERVAGTGTTRRSVVLARAEGALAARKAADIELLESALDWALAHPTTDLETCAVWGERELPFREGGAPEVGPRGLSR